MENLNFRHICIADPVTGVIVHSLGHKKYPCPPRVPSKRFELFKKVYGAVPDN